MIFGLSQDKAELLTGAVESMTQNNWEEQWDKLLTIYLKHFANAIIKGHADEQLNRRQDKILVDFIRSELQAVRENVLVEILAEAEKLDTAKEVRHLIKLKILA